MTDELRQTLEAERAKLEERIRAIHEERHQLVRRLNALYELLQPPEAEQKQIEETTK